MGASAPAQDGGGRKQSIIVSLGDVVYSFRYRSKLPQSVVGLAPEGKEWVIRGKGKAAYAFELVDAVRIRPNEDLVVTKVPDATPEIVAACAQGDEQALLALVRYNRLVDVFLGVTAYSLQSHLRTFVDDIGQVEIDELYAAVDRFGVQYIVPVQAKAHGDEIGIAQLEQDFAVCAEKWPSLVPRPTAAQFMSDGVIALFEFAFQDDRVRVLRESHYRLVAASGVSDKDRALYRRQAESGGEVVAL